MKFFIIIEKNALYTYGENGSKYEVQYIEGDESFSINANSINDDISLYMETLANEKNLKTRAELEFDILMREDSTRDTAIFTALGDHVDKKYMVNDVIKRVLKKLNRDKTLLIEQYGINYDGYSYKNAGSDISQGDFDLMAYTIHSKDIINLMDAI